MGKPSENSDSYKVNLTQADLMAAVLVTFLFFALQFRLTKNVPFVLRTELHSDDESKELQNGGLPSSSWHSGWYVQARLAIFLFIYLFISTSQARLWPLVFQLAPRKKPCANGMLFDLSFGVQSRIESPSPSCRQCTFPAGSADLQSSGGRASGL